MKNNANDEDDDSPIKQQRAEINIIIVLLVLFITSTISFLMGKMIIVSRSSQPRIVSVINSNDTNKKTNEEDDFATTKSPIVDIHPPISLQNGKLPPLHKYIGMDFDGANMYGQSTNSHLLTNFGTSEQICDVSENGDKLCEIDNTKEWIDQEHIKHDNDEYLPSGQHLLIDILHVDSQFLNSGARLAQAMVQVVNSAELTLLSYHCHNLNPQGVSCVGVLLESHIAFHTWPEAGAITLDLFTCGSGKLVPLVPLIEELFAIPKVGSLEKPLMKWVHKLRGFDSDNDDNNIMKVDVGDMLGSSYDIKHEIASVQTTFQRIDVFDLESSSKYKLSQRETSYREENPSLFQPQRIVYLDGVIQSTRHNLSAYHEALVHPVMFAHNNPKRVAIIGGGEGATLMEVLKHNTLEKVQMIEIDEEMVKTSRQYLQEWSDCSDIIGSEKWCGDDSRSEIFYEDALAWFIDRYSPHGKLAQEHHSKLDVIIMDALDPQDDIPFAEILYTDEVFLNSLYNSLNDDGMIVFQLGEAPDHHDAADHLNANRRRAILMKRLETLGFESFHIYEDSHCGFEYPWTFFIATKDFEDDTMWYRNEAETQIAIHKRILRTYSGNPALKYFDGATMKGYQVPHKAFESVYCRQTPTPESCLTIDDRNNDVSLSDLEVKASTFGDGSGRGVFTKVDIPKGAAIGRKESAQPVYFSPSTTALLFNRVGDIEELSAVYDYMDGYGWHVDAIGSDSYYVDSSLSTFENHGCNGTFNVGTDMAKAEQVITEQNAKPSDYINYREENYNWDDKYNAYRLRHVHHLCTRYEKALRDIKAGEEILTDYMDFQEGDEWYPEVQELKRICNKEVVGFITGKEARDPIPN